MEIYKDIIGYDGVYQISNLGNVKSNKWNKSKVLKNNKNNFGYCFVILRKNNKSKTLYIHQLVAIHFLNHKPCGHNLVINHINFNKEDNRVENLEIVTQRKNTNKKHIKSSSKYVGVDYRAKKKKWRANIFKNNKLVYLGTFNCEFKAHLAYQKALKSI